MTSTPKKSKGPLQVVSKGSWKGTSKYPFYKKSKSYSSAIQQRKSSTTQHEHKQQPLPKDQHRSISKHVSSLFSIAKKKSVMDILFPNKKKLQEAQIIIGYAKKVLFALLSFLTIISLTTVIMYVYDYVKGDNTPKEKEMLKTLLIFSVLSLFVCIILLSLVIHYKFITIPSFIPTIGIKIR